MSVSDWAGHGTRASGGFSQQVLIGAVAGLALVVCLPTIGTLSYLLDNVEYYGHAFLIPPMAAYLAYCNRRKIAAALRDLSPPRFGWVIAFGAAAFEALAFIGDVGSAAGLGISVVFGAAAYGIGGLRLLRPLLLPLAFLALMIPPPEFVTYELLFRLKLFVTQVSVALLQAGGATVLADGNVIQVPQHALFVADACSGLTSIVTMLPLSCIVAYFLSHGVWRRAAVVASVIPLAIGANVVRVIGTVLTVSIVGAESAQGALHESFGVATYAIGTLAVIAVARLLR